MSPSACFERAPVERLTISVALNRRGPGTGFTNPSATMETHDKEIDPMRLRAFSARAWRCEAGFDGVRKYIANGFIFDHFSS